VRQGSLRDVFIITDDGSCDDLTWLFGRAENDVTSGDPFAEHPDLASGETGRDLACSGLLEVRNPLVAEVTQVLRKLVRQVFVDLVIGTDEPVLPAELGIPAGGSEHHLVEAARHSGPRFRGSNRAPEPFSVDLGDVDHGADYINQFDDLLVGLCRAPSDAVHLRLQHRRILGTPIELAASECQFDVG